MILPEFPFHSHLYINFHYHPHSHSLLIPRSHTLSSSQSFSLSLSGWHSPHSHTDTHSNSHLCSHSLSLSLSLILNITLSLTLTLTITLIFTLSLTFTLTLLSFSTSPKLWKSKKLYKCRRTKPDLHRINTKFEHFVRSPLTNYTCHDKHTWKWIWTVNLTIRRLWIYIYKIYEFKTQRKAHLTKKKT